MPERVANVAVLIGGIDPSHIGAIIDASNTQGLILHGIKRAGCFDKICREGVLPLTPEGGQVSFWASGERIFGDASFPMGTFDTPFFNYAIARDEKSKVSSMNLAMAGYFDVMPASEFERDGVLCVPRVVEPRELYLLQVRSSYAREGLQASGDRVKQFVAERLYETMRSGDWKGRIERIEI
ncbi:MAG TPA: hypothetical protein VJC07_03810 [Candidatus Nanoarchaeia archaeon]|nr:hypothetical protein [Candidatus Nanoarchaeia archaeon]